MSAAEIEYESSEKCPKCGTNLIAAAKELPVWLSDILKDVEKCGTVEDFLATEKRMEIEVYPFPEKKIFLRMQRKIKQKGYLCAIRKTDDGAKLYILKYPEQPKRNVLLNVGLLIATVISTFLAGYLFLFKSVISGLLFSLALICMLGAHEVGHLLAARKNGIQTSLPYFIPFPSLFGTMGAIVEMREPPSSRDAMVEIGSFGPATGFVLSLFFITVGLTLSSPVEESKIHLTPLVFGMIRRFLELPPNLDLHPFAYAGWVMLIITFLNLMPLGQLDGGHVARAVLGPKKHFYSTRMLALILFFSGLFYPEHPFWIWGLLAFILFSREHPGALDDVHPLSRKAKFVVMACLSIFILCIPIPGW